MPRWEPVDSSLLDAIAYENGDLWVRFKKGPIYTYLFVPPEVYQGLKHAHDSHGKFFIANVKNAHYINARQPDEGGKIEFPGDKGE